MGVVNFRISPANARGEAQQFVTRAGRDHFARREYRGGDEMSFARAAISVLAPALRVMVSAWPTCDASERCNTENEVAVDPRDDIESTGCDVGKVPDHVAARVNREDSLLPSPMARPFTSSMSADTTDMLMTSAPAGGDYAVVARRI